MNRQKITVLERQLAAADIDTSADPEVLIFVPHDGRNPVVLGRHGSVALYDPDAADVGTLIAGQGADRGQ